MPTNVVFGSFFLIYMGMVLSIGLWTKRFREYTVMMFIGCVLQVLGFISRIYASSNPFSDVSSVPAVIGFAEGIGSQTGNCRQGKAGEEECKTRKRLKETEEKSAHMST